MELLILNQHWQDYTTQNVHHGWPVGSPCQVRFRLGKNDKLIVAVRFSYSLSKDLIAPINRRMRYPNAHYWYFPGLEDEVLARSERDKPELRHTAAPMRPY